MSTVVTCDQQYNSGIWKPSSKQIITLYSTFQSMVLISEIIPLVCYSGSHLTLVDTHIFKWHSILSLTLHIMHAYTKKVAFPISRANVKLLPWLCMSVGMFGHIVWEAVQLNYALSRFPLLQSDLTNAGGRVLLITFGSPSTGQKWNEETKSEFEMLCDTEKKVK